MNASAHNSNLYDLFAYLCMRFKDKTANQHPFKGKYQIIKKRASTNQQLILPDFLFISRKNTTVLMGKITTMIKRIYFIQTILLPFYRELSLVRLFNLAFLFDFFFQFFLYAFIQLTCMFSASLRTDCSRSFCKTFHCNRRLDFQRFEHQPAKTNYPLQEFN